MKISIVTDEISADPETAIELGLEWGIRDFELRGFFADRVPELSAYQKDRLGEILAIYEARIIAISPGLFKIPYPLEPRDQVPLAWMDQAMHRDWRSRHEEVRYHCEELLPASIEFARALGVGLILIFSFHRGAHAAGPVPDPVNEMLHQAATEAAAAGIQLAVETEAGFWADTGQRSAALVNTIGHPALGINWDPGNAFMAGDTPFPDGYEAVKPLVKHVHFKDAMVDDYGVRRYVVHGQIDWAGQIQALADDEYDGYISVETHLRPKVSIAREEVDMVRQLIARSRRL